MPIPEVFIGPLCQEELASLRSPFADRLGIKVMAGERHNIGVVSYGPEYDEGYAEGHWRPENTGQEAPPNTINYGMRNVRGGGYYFTVLA